MVHVASGGRHQAHFYDDPEVLADRVAGYFAHALSEGGGAIALARADCVRAFEARLERHGVDLARERAADRYLVLDADALCDDLVPGAMPDAERFFATVKPALARVRSAVGDAPIHVYGELVDLLWSIGKRDAVIRLEQLWSDLCRAEPFALLCGYQLESFAASEHTPAFDLICAHHDTAPAERTIAALTQRARALELEVERRAHVERQVQELLELAGELSAATTHDEVVRLTVERGADVLGAVGGALHPTITTTSRFSGSRAIAPVADTGSLVFEYDRDRVLEPAERTFVEILARQCANALERVRLLDTERRARAEAEEATRAREELLSVVSHELRNPLGTITIAASALRTSDSDRTRKHAERIHRQATRMARLLGDLVDFAGIQAGKLALQRAPHPPKSIISAAGELFGPLAEERGLAFAAEAPELPPVECDSERAVQVLANLVANAIKVTPPGGTVRIGARSGEPTVFFVRDTGPGIAPEDLPRLFERYWRSKTAEYKGTGLGLSIARGIVDAHGGRIWAESEVGVGSTFYFSL
jgi:signal transduction histidine kinase